MTDFRLLVTGSRTWTDYPSVLDEVAVVMLEQMAARIFDGIVLPDTAPSEILPTEEQPA